jgi:hypothetical protein
MRIRALSTATMHRTALENSNQPFLGLPPFDNINNNDYNKNNNNNDDLLRFDQQQFEAPDLQSFYKMAFR